MAIRISNIQLPVEQPEQTLDRVAAKQLGLNDSDILRWRILRKSLDARSKYRLTFVYSILIELPAEIEHAHQFTQLKNVDILDEELFAEPASGNSHISHRPVVIGSGPAGLLAAYYLALRGYKPLIIERGQSVKERMAAIRSFDAGGDFDRENNYLFGEGGAGAFSDGKLTCRMGGPDVEWVLQRIIECGGKPSIIYEHRPHLGSNRLPLIVRNFRRMIEKLGGDYRFGCQMEKLEVIDGRVVGIQTSGGSIQASQVILGIGHSARDSYQMLYDVGVPMVPKAFQLGLRIEQPQEQVNAHKYGKPEYLDMLGAADYTLVARAQRDLYTFCMCAGGSVIPSISEPGMFCSNGMSNSKHDTAFANSGLMITLEPGEFGSSHPLAGVELQRTYERVAFEITGRNYEAPIQRASDFLMGRQPDPNEKLPSSYRRGVKPANLALVIPPSVVEAIRAGLPLMDKRWRGDFLKNATLVGPEMRGSAPVRIERDRDTWQAPGIDGLYPVGEGAGYAGGIISAAVDGLRSAKKIVEQFAPLS